ncbi:MAG TPA: DUF6531 domain-containing protein [Pseudobdellovibrionaceae bacterium]|nr:DUF6531 domain-containing protein [Pseudobdellovibrionaceae bacterium]
MKKLENSQRMSTSRASTPTALRSAAVSAIAGTALFVSLSADATVDMKNANYTESWLDIQVQTTGYPLKVQRTYNSRSVFNGIFGFGWCSDFETTLEKTPEGSIKLTECGAGQEIYFKPESKTADSAKTELIKKIIAEYKKSNPTASKDIIANMEAELEDNAEYRARRARLINLPEPQVQKGVTYTSDSLQIDSITFDGSTYTRSLSDGSSQRFDPQGRLTAIYDKNGNYLRLTYAGPVLREVADNTGKKLAFQFYPTKRVKEISGPGGVKASYKYVGEDLAEVKNMWKNPKGQPNTYTFEYDDNHNLTKVTYPDRTFKALTYNKQKDWVTSFQDRSDGKEICKETYNYETSKTTPQDHFWSEAEKKCGNEIVNKARFEFWLKKRSDGRRYLSRVMNKSQSDTVDITYHPEFGRPTSVKKGSNTTAFEYYDNGLIKVKSNANSKMSFEYNKQHNKVARVITEYFDAKGKAAAKRDTTFSYDGKGNLIAAQNSDGQSVRLTYDARGRIATIIDHAKKEVQIKYEEKSGRPAQITRPKVGTIMVTYKSNGEIRNVVSPDGGPTVALQVASTFNNLLDIIAPATSELNL